MSDKPVMREWRGRVPKEMADDYERALHDTGLRDYAATPGNLGIWLLRDDSGKLTEFITLTLWESLDAIRSFAGDDVTRARYYPEIDSYLVDPPERVRHYRVRWEG